jgi:LPS-assembly protein
VLSSRFPVITTRANVGSTYYRLDNSSNINRTIAGTGVDLAFPFISQGNLYGSEVNHQLTPKISYNYRAKEVQGNIPIFDSTDKYDDIVTFADLTSGERYTGLDRITNANDFTLSIESSHRDVNALADDKDLLNMKIAQSYYTDDEVVSDTANTNYETRRSYSDIAASIDVAISNFTFGTAVQFDPDQSSIVKKENSLSYILNPRKFVSITLSDEGSKKTSKFSVAYPLSKYLHLFGGLDRTTSTGVTNSETTGIAYESCCWALRLAHFKEDNGSGGYNYSTGAELVLSGLGSTSSPLKDRIEQRIPDYSANLRYKP